MDDAQQLRDMIKRRDESAERAILEYIDQYGKAYSKELREPAGGLSLTHVRTLLRRLESRGLLESWLVNPPHEDCRSSGLRRGYYRRLSNISGNKT